MRLRESQILTHFDGMTAIRAREYERTNKVIEANITGEGWVFGRVKGTVREPYEQVLQIVLTKDGCNLLGGCSCPVGSGCKHILAVLLRLLREGRLEVEETEAAPKSQTSSPSIERWLSKMRDASDVNQKEEALGGHHLALVLDNRTADLKTSVITAESVRSNASQTTARPLRRAAISNGQFGKYVSPAHRALLRAFEANLTGIDSAEAAYRLDSVLGSLLLQRAIETKLVFWHSPNGPGPLALGKPREAAIRWTVLPSGSQAIEVEGLDGEVVLTDSPWYIDPSDLTCGPLNLGIDPAVAAALLAAPVILPEFSHHVRSHLQALTPKLIQLIPKELERPAEVRGTVQPRLRITKQKDVKAFRASRSEPEPWSPVATLDFLYSGIEAPADTSPIRAVIDGKPVVIKRDVKAEEQARDLLSEAGWAHSDSLPFHSERSSPAQWSMREPDPDQGHQQFYGFLADELPVLRNSGWIVETGEGIPAQAVESSGVQIEAQTDAKDGYRLAITAGLAERQIGIERLIRTLKPNQAFTSAGRRLYFEPEEGLLLAFEPDELKNIWNLLRELFGNPSGWDGAPRLSKLSPRDMDELQSRAPHFQIPAEMDAMVERLRALRKPGNIKPPPGFVGSLREYQLQGVAWMRFLADFGLGGILADDMGLGKTVQAIAHILEEKAAGRLKQPALIIAPTSTLPNWSQELERFAPKLKLLVLHGAHRKSQFSCIDLSHVVLTSYPLLVRDRAEFAKRQFQMVILDEAQFIKNSETGAAKLAFSLQANHRIAMSGTPLENNLDELWSLFRFSLPGLLGTATEFKRMYRIPIENRSDGEAAKRLLDKVRPFMLRRTKDLVLSELPPKTEIIEQVELGEKQRALYDRIRLTLSAKVRSLLSSKGIDRSRIEVLEALLRLRQTCCDPRLLKLEDAETMGSAKLERLMEMIAELQAEKRSAIVFSQFTSMLDLIEERLGYEGIQWVRISGDTEDRRTPVERFQRGEVSLFLISLRAGGTGLNLTAADTVIHFDPWWNPAVENQATDRAHRIGQEKPVFVYKLVAADSVEEKILALQQRKAQLASNMLAGVADGIERLSEADIQWIFGSPS